MQLDSVSSALERLLLNVLLRRWVLGVLPEGINRISLGLGKYVTYFVTIIIFAIVSNTRNYFILCASEQEQSLNKYLILNALPPR